MTATEMLVSSRLMKTDDPPSSQEAVKRNKKQEDEQTDKYETKNVPATFEQLPENKTRVELFISLLHLLLDS